MGSRVRVSADPLAAAGVELADALLRVLAQHGRARLAIPGGSALAALPAVRERLGGDWQRVALTWVDERCVSEADPASNRGAARRLGVLDDLPPEHVLPLYLDGESPAEAVARAARGLRMAFGDEVDVLLLGLGEDGHIASLFPSRQQPTGGSVAFVGDSPKPPAERITLTRAILGTAGAAVLFAAGEAKRSALARLVDGDSRFPAHGLPGLVIVTDQDPTKDSSAKPRRSATGATRP